MQVKQAMTREVRTCRPGDSLVRPAQIMWEADVGCVPVTDDGGALAGVVTDRDICLAANRFGLPLAQIPVGLAMSLLVHSCSPDDTIESAEALMREQQVRRLPVVAQGKVVGILSLSDLSRAVEREPNGQRREWLMMEVERTFIEVVKPRALPMR
jgi:CBS domain-containing protein